MAMDALRTEPLCTIRLLVDAPIRMLGQTPFGERRIATIAGGSFEGPQLRGEVLSGGGDRSEEHTSELQSLMRISYAVFCLKKKNVNQITASKLHNNSRKLHT